MSKKSKILLSIAIVIIVLGLVATGIFVYDKLADKNDTNIEENNNTKKNNESKENDAEKITKFIKNKMASNWTYSRDKLTVDSDNGVEIIFDNVDDWSTCGYNANKNVLKITENGDDILNKISSITFICKDSNSNLVSKASYTNISSINKENVESNAAYYDANNNIINSSVESGYQSACKSYSYKEIFRNPEDYLHKKIKITGEVVQVMEETDDGVDYWILRVNMTKDSWGYYDDTIMVLLEKSIVKGRIIEDDIFTFYGEIGEPVTYETVLGASQTVPSVLAYYAHLDK